MKIGIFQNAPLSWPTVACDLDQPGVKLSGLRDDLLHEGRAAVPGTAVSQTSSSTHLTLTELGSLHLEMGVKTCKYKIYNVDTSNS